MKVNPQRARSSKSDSRKARLRSGWSAENFSTRLKPRHRGSAAGVGEGRSSAPAGVSSIDMASLPGYSAADHGDIGIYLWSEELDDNEVLTAGVAHFHAPNGALVGDQKLVLARASPFDGGPSI